MNMFFSTQIIENTLASKIKGVNIDCNGIRGMTNMNAHTVRANGALTYRESVLAG
jgi:hypothetical protein